MGGVPSPGPGRGGPRSRSRWGVPGLRWGGVPGLRSGGGTWSQYREKFLTQDLAWYMFRLEKFFVKGPPPPVKGKIFDTRFGLIHVQTGKKIFVEGPPPVKGKIFDTRFGLIHVQTEEKIFVEGPPSPPRNSKDLLWLRGGWYASCIHTGGLSCWWFDLRVLPQNFGPMVGTYEGLLLLCECRWGGDHICMWWGPNHYLLSSNFFDLEVVRTLKSSITCPSPPHEASLPLASQGVRPCPQGVSHLVKLSLRYFLILQFDTDQTRRTRMRHFVIILAISRFWRLIPLKWFLFSRNTFSHHNWAMNKERGISRTCAICWTGQ